MKHLSFFVMLVITTNNIFAQNESFVNVEEYRRTNEQSQIRKQQAQVFLENEVQINEERRRQKQLLEQQAQDYQDLQNEEFSIAQQDRAFVPIDAIVLDAGHGGWQPGGVANGIHEKRLVFSLLKKTHTLFRKRNPNLTVYVTRKNDSYLSLEDRVSKTTRWSTRKNVLFISIHANIAYNPKVEGLEIYTLSDKASDPDALAVERVENAGFSEEDIQKTESLYSILGDLIRDSTRKQSEWFAQYVYEDMLASADVLGRGLKRANFFVLKYNTVPSILIEVGYMSSPKEAKRLQDDEHQNKLAAGMFNGISRYIQEYNKTEGFTK